MRRWALALSLLAAPAFLRPRVGRVARRASDADAGGLALWLLEQGAQVNSGAAVQGSAAGRGIWSTQPLQQGAEGGTHPLRAAAHAGHGARGAAGAPRSGGVPQHCPAAHP